MYCITSIEVQKKDESRVSVFVNGQFEFGAPKKLIERYGIVQGMIFDAEKYAQLLENVQLERARNRVFDYLARGNKTEKQVRDKLIEWEYSLVIVDQLMSFLKQYNYVDDEVYSKRYIESKMTYGKKSLRQVQSLLYAKGIKSVDKEIIGDQAETIEYENIQYYLKKFKYSKQLEYKDRQKIVGKIMGRGFSYSLIEKAIREMDESNVG